MSRIQHTHLHVRSRGDLRNGASLAVIAMAASTVAGAAFAADPPATATSSDGKATEVGAVVVTGYRSSLAKAINIKRASTAEVDTILAEDIGKFPDLNLAESLQRVPGIAITREGGEGRQISVRGLGPQYTRVRINGMEALSTVGAPDNDGGVNRTRDFDFDVFASDLFNELTVRKTAEANVDEGSLGATVDLRTAEPFDYPGFKFIATAKGDYNDLAKTTGPRASVLLSDTWDDGKLGALVSFAYSHRNFDDTGSSTVRWDEGNVLSTGTGLVGFGSVQGTNCQVTTLPAVCATADSALHPRFPRYDIFQDDQTREGVTASLQWAPNANNQFTLDGLHSYFGGSRQEQYLEAPGFSGTGKCSSAATCTSIANIGIVSDTINSAGVMTSGVFNGVDTRVEDRIDELHTNFNQLTLKGRNDINDRIGFDELIGVSKSDFENPVQTTIGFDQYNVQGFSYSYEDGRVPMLNFGSANVGVGGPWVLTEVRERPQSAINQYKTAQVNGHFKFNENLKFEAGVNFKQYDFATTSFRLVNGESVTSSNVYKTLQAIPTSTYSLGASLANAGLSVPAGSTSWITPSVSLAETALGLNSNSTLFALSTTGDLGNNASDRERDVGAYVQADFQFDVLGRPLHGNLGVRDVNTNQASQGYEFVANVLSPVAASHSYDNVLPALNLDWDPFDRFKIRFGAAKVMARPDLASLVGSTTLSVSGSSYTVKTGNPDLKPFLANAYDLAFEYYPQSGAIYSFAVFRKDVQTFVTTNPTIRPFTGNPFGIPDSAAIAACGSTPGCSPSANWTFSTPTNTQGGYIQGAEFNVQQPFTFLPGLLQHTGVLANVTFVDSSVSYPQGVGLPNVSNELLNLSKVSYNWTVYYEDERWSARVSGAYRSKYLTRVPGQETGTDADGFDPTFNLDASIQYTVNKNFKLTLEGVNLTDQYENEFDDTTKDLSYYYHHTGREILFGGRLNF